MKRLLNHLKAKAVETYCKVKSSNEYKAAKKFVKEVKKAYDETVAEYKQCVEIDNIVSYYKDHEYEFINEKYYNNLPLMVRMQVAERKEKLKVPLSDIEFMRYEHFCKNHKHCNTEGSEADVEIIESHNSGIGANVTLKCKKCGEERDITDYGSW